MINVFNSLPTEITYILFFAPIIASILLLGYIVKKLLSKEFTAIRKAKYALGVSFLLLTVFVIQSTFLLQLKGFLVLASLLIICMDYISFRIMKDAQEK